VGNVAEEDYLTNKQSLLLRNKKLARTDASIHPGQVLNTL